MRFASKIDGWLVPVVLISLLLFSVFRNTWYEVGKTELRIVSGPFKWKIPLEDIVEIEPTRNPLSAPALSMDRLKISYGKRKFMLVSPSNKEGFIAALEQARHGRA